MSKKLFCIVSFLCLAASLVMGQQQPPITTSQLVMPIYTVNIAPATQANLSVSGTPGNQTIYYWMVSHFALGESNAIGPFVIQNAPSTLSGSNYVQIFPTYPGGGLTSIDILKTSSPVAPTGTCNCAVATGLTSGGVNDQSNSTSSYTLSAIIESSYTMTLANEVQGSGSTHLILRQNGVLVADLSNAGSGNLPAGCSNGQLPSWNGSTWVCTTAGTGTVTGSGSLNAVPKWLTGGTGLTNSAITDNGSIVLVNGEEFEVTGPSMGVGPGTPALSLSQNAGNSSSACSNYNLDLTHPFPLQCISSQFSFVPNSSSTITSSFAFWIATASNAQTVSNVMDSLAATSLSQGTVAESRAIHAAAVSIGSTSINTGVFAETFNDNSNFNNSVNRALYAINVYNNGGAGPSGATNSYGLYVDTPNISGSTSTISHQYGIYIADQAAAGTGVNSDPWGIYEAGTAKNQLGGALTILGVLTTNMTGGPFCVHETSGVLTATASDCGSGGGGGANTALSNLASVSINTSLLAQTAVDLGAAATPFRNLYLFGGGTYGTDSFELTGTSTANRTQTLQDVTDTFVYRTTTDTLTNKTLTSATLGGSGTVVPSGATLTIQSGGTLTCAGGSTCPTSSFSPTITSPQSTQTISYNGSAWVNGYGGVNVDPQTGTYTFSCPTDRLGEIEFNISSAATLNLPQAGSTTCTQSSMALVVRNASASTALLTISPTTSTFQPEGTSTLTILPGGAAFIYSDATSSTGNYHDIPIPTAFGGVNAQTANYALTQLDKDKLIVMNCTSACAATLPATAPSSKWNTRILSIGSTLATVSLNSVNFNGSSTAPTLTTGRVIQIATDGTSYYGDINSSGSGTGTINAAAQYDVPYYSASGSNTTISGAAISGIQLDSTTGAPTALTLGTGLTLSSGTLSPAFASLTTTGSSGAATLSGGVLNIPQYSGGGSGGSITGLSGLTTGSVYYNVGGTYIPANAYGIPLALTVTFTNSSAVISATNTLIVGAAVQFQTTGSLPTNFSTSTTYYVISTGLSTSQFEVSATYGGSAITAGSAGSGTQTLTIVPTLVTNPAYCVASSSTVCVFSGPVTTGTWTAGQAIYVSDATSGALTQTNPASNAGSSGHFVQRVGVATSTSAILVTISPDVATVQ